MKKFFFISLSCFFKITICFSQAYSIKWQKCLGGNGKDSSTGVKKTLDNGFVIVGCTNSTSGDVVGNHGAFDGWIVKLDSLGNILWSKTVGGSSNDYISTIEITKDSGILIAGSTNSNNGDFANSRGLTDAWIMKLNNIGNIVWKKQVGGVSNDLIKSIAITSNDTIIAYGSTSSNNTGDLIGLPWPLSRNGNPCFNSNWIIKFDLFGNILFNSLSDGGSSSGSYSDYSIEPSNVYATSDNGYILISTTNSYFTRWPQSSKVLWKNTTPINYDWYYITFNLNYGFSYDDNVGIVQSYDSGYYITSGSNNELGSATLNRIRKINNFGKVKWIKTFYGQYSNFSKPVAIDILNKSQIIAGSFTKNTSCGNCDSFSVLPTYIHDSSYTDFWIINLDTSGKFNWQKCFGGSSNEFLAGLQSTDDVGIVATGTAYSNDGDVSGNHGNGDFWVVKLKANHSLPVKLKSFEAKSKLLDEVILNWIVETEINVLKYNIEMSLNGKDYIKIGTINSSGNQEYSFIDKKRQGIIYYRLEIIDKDGSINYSDIKKILLDKKFNFTIYPNPSKDKLLIKSNNKGIYKINNVLGKTFQSGTINYNFEEINISNLANGIYFLNFISQNNVVTMQFIKD